VPLQSWLDLLCRMIPGVSQAVLLTEPAVQPTPQWPESQAIDPEVISAARLAASQKKPVTTTLSADDTTADMVFALYLSGAENFSGSVAVRVNVRPAQQSAVMQILHWGEKWLQLILKQQQDVRQGEGRPGILTGSIRDIRSAWKNRRLMLLSGAFLLLAAISMIPGNYRVSAPARLEGSIQRVVVAPFDSYITNAYARAGETVAAGDVIAELDSSDLLLQQQRFSAEKNEYTRQYRQALGARDQAQALIYKSQVKQADAQLSLLEKKIQRSTLAAPLDGVIIAGDLSRSLGAPVKTGDVLFEVAPLDEYRLVILVDEQRVADVKQGMRGELTLKALPATRLGFTVHKISPVFEENAKGIAYRVEARLGENHPGLRPGMQGVAKISIDRRSYLWIYLHDLVDALRLWLWSWMP
jgi:multidrug resistance efflux pump